MVKIIKEYKIYILFFILFFVINNRIALLLYSDDGVYLKQVNEQGILNFVIDKTINWQPRFFSFFCQAVMYKSLLLWKILNSLIMTLSLIIIEKMITLNKPNMNINYLRLFIVCGIFLIYPNVITSAVLWYTGSFFYLWPFIFFMIAMCFPVYLLYGKEINNKYIKILIIISTIISSYTEQYISILIVFLLIVSIYQYVTNKKVNRFLLIQFIVAFINLVIFAVLRIETSAKKDLFFYFPNYSMLDLMEKIYNGFNYVNGYYINQSNLLFFTLSLFIFLIYMTQIRNNDNKNILVDITFSLPLVYMAIRLIPFNSITSNFWLMRDFASKGNLGWGNSNIYNVQDILNNYIYDTMATAPNHMITNLYLFLSPFVSFFIIILLGLSIFILMPSIKDKILCICLYGAAFASGYVISFTPTVFETGGRVFFIGNMLILILIGKLYLMFIEKYIEKYSKIFTAFSILLVFNTMLAFLLYIFKYT